MGDLTEDELNRKAFAARLRQALGTESGRSLARRIGAGEASMNPYLNGTSWPGADRAWQIACALGVSSDWLIAGKGPMRPDESAVSDNPPVASATSTAPPSFWHPGLTMKVMAAVVATLRAEGLADVIDPEKLAGIVEVYYNAEIDAHGERAFDDGHIIDLKEYRKWIKLAV